MKTEEFFKNHPDAPEVFKVGDQLFLKAHAGSARSHGQRFGLKVVVVKNPKNVSSSKVSSVKKTGTKK